MSSTALVKQEAMEIQPMTAADVESLVVYGDLNKLSPQGRIAYYHKRCEDMGLDYLSKPFDLILLNGKLQLYANKGCFEQLRSARRISIAIVSRDRFDELFVVTARATTPDGRSDEATGAVNLGDLKGEAAANAIMKAETKAKRRVTLSICGMGMLDETEVETIRGATKVHLEAGGEIVGESASAHGHTYLTAWKGIPLGDQDHIFEKGSHDYCKGCEALWVKLTDEERDGYRKAYTEWIKAASIPGAERATPTPRKPRTPKKEAVPITGANFAEFLERMAKAKEAIGEADYYRILKRSNYKHANEIKTLDAQTQVLLEMTDCFRSKPTPKMTPEARDQQDFRNRMAACIDKNKDAAFDAMRRMGYDSMDSMPATEEGRRLTLEEVEEAVGIKP